MVKVHHPDIFKFIKFIKLDYGLQRAKLARFEAGLQPKAEGAKIVKKNRAIFKAVSDYVKQLNDEHILPDDEEDDDDSSDGSYEFEDDEDDEDAPRYAIVSQKSAIEANPHMQLMNKIAHNCRL